MDSPADSLAEDIDLLLASIGLLSSIVDRGGGKRPQDNDSVAATTTATTSKPTYEKVPPCDVPRGIEEESCPPSPAVQLHLDLPKQDSDQETASPSSEGSARPSLLTPHASVSLGDELLSSISSSSPIGGFSESSYPSRLHIEEHFGTARSSQVLPLTPNEKPLPTPLNITGEINFKSASPTPKAGSFGMDSGLMAAPESESPVIKNLREFSKLYESNRYLFGAHSRARSTNDITTQFSTQRIRPGRLKPLDGEHARSMIEVLPPVPKSPPPIPPTPEGHTLSRQNSIKALPSQLRYQLSKGALRQPVPNRLPPLNRLDDRPRPQTEFRVDVASTSSGPSRDPRFGQVPYTSPAVQTQFSVHTPRPPPVPAPAPPPLMEQDEPSSVESVYSNEQVLHIYRPMPQRKRSSTYSEMSMTHSDPDQGNGGGMLDDDDDDDDAQSYMSNPLDGMRSPISPDQTIFLDGRPRPRRDEFDGMAQPVSFFDLGFEMDIGRLKKRSKWKFWSKIKKHQRKPSM